MVIERRHVLIGGLAGLIVPALARAQGGGGPGGPGPQPQPRPNEPELRRPDPLDQGQMQSMEQTGPVAQPPQIRALILSQSYRATPRFTLANTTGDAELIVRAFRRLDFDSVIHHGDGSPAETSARIAAYLDSLDPNTIALVYVAGHGVEIGGENLLLLEGAESFLSLQSLVQTMRQRAGVVILFLDACRNNPFGAEDVARAQVSRAVSLEPADAVRLQTISLGELRAASGAPGRLRPFQLQGSNIRIVFSTDPANVALDDVEGSRNGPFATALARHIRRPYSLDDIISLTTGEVVRVTRRAQYPWSQGSIGRPIYFSGPNRRRRSRRR